MGSLFITIFGWIAAVVAAVALIAGPADAASLAGNAMRTVGITAGAMIGSIDSAVAGFRDASGTGGGKTNGTLFGGEKQGGGQKGDRQRQRNRDGA